MKNEDPSITEEVNLLFESTPELYDGGLPEEEDDESDDADDRRLMAMDDHLALKTFAFATRLEKARIYARYKNIRVRLKS